MKEQDLKKRFVQSLLSGEIKGAVDGMDIPFIQKKGKIIRLKDEAYFRYFDLVIGIISIKRDLSEKIKIDSVEAYDRYHNIIMRTSELKTFAREEKCRIDSIDLIPVEFKSDNDTLDERLPKQVISAIMAFGRSIVVFDKGHAARVRKHGLFRLLPATIIGYSVENNFEVISSYGDIISDSLVKPPKSAYAKLLRDNGLIDKLSSVYPHISMIQRICQKTMFNQIFEEKIELLDEEIDFLSELGRKPDTHEKKDIKKLVEQSINMKITDYV